MAIEERRRLLRASLNEMDANMKMLAESAAAKHSDQIHKLTNLVELRDRQLSRAVSSPRLGMRSRPASANVRLLDVKPLKQAASNSAPTFSNQAGLFVVPSLSAANPNAMPRDAPKQLSTRRKQFADQVATQWSQHEAEDVQRVFHGRLFGGARMSHNVQQGYAQRNLDIRTSASSL